MPVVPGQVSAGRRPANNLHRDNRYRTKPDKSGAGPISAIPVVEVISVVIPAADTAGINVKI